MVRITQDFLNHLSPVELSFIRTGIDKLYKEIDRRENDIKILEGE